jgi:hypothetical protein
MDGDEKAALIDRRYNRAHGPAAVCPFTAKRKAVARRLARATATTAAHASPFEELRKCNLAKTGLNSPQNAPTGGRKIPPPAPANVQISKLAATHAGRTKIAGADFGNRQH